MEFGGPLAGPAAAGTDRGNGVEQGQYQLRVGGVGGGDEDGEREAAPVAQNVDL